MVIVVDGKNIIRDLLSGASTNYVDQAGLGTVDTAPSETDTGLNANTNLGVSGTIKKVSYTLSDKQVNFVYSLLSTEGTATTYKEIGLSSSGANQLFNRQIFYDLTHENTDELQFSMAVSIR